MRTAPLTCLLLAACAATSNPEPEAVRPAAPTPPAAAQAAQDPPVAGPGREAGASRPEEPVPQEPVPQEPAQQEPGATAPAPPAEPVAPAGGPLPVGTVGGEPIDVRDFLGRLWVRDAERAREVFEYLVLSRVALFEADRLGVRIDPALADETVERAWAVLRQRLEESGSKLTLEQHVQRTLEMELADYERRLRSDAIVQLLTERVVRAWYLASPRVQLRLTELADDAALDAALAALDAGTPFEDVARAHGSDVDAQQGGTVMTVVRSEASELARLGFSTPVGEVAGPLVQGGRFLLLRPEQRLEPVEGPWSEVGPAVEASLAETPIDSDRLEYAQWRTAMMRRYPIDLSPFLELVTGTAP